MIQIDGMDAVRARLRQITQRMQRPEPYLRAAGVAISRSIAQNFLAQGRPTAWPRRVSDAQGRPKYTDPATHPILRKSGRMANAAVSTNNRGESVSRLTRKSNRDHYYDQGLTVPYAMYHQSEEPREKLARRPFLLFQIHDVSGRIAQARLFFWRGRL